jgi:predicted secreted Zn-dependent protease
MAAILFLAAPAQAEVTVSTSEERYIVEGTTRAQIARFYKQREEEYSAYAQPAFKYSFTWVKQGDYCAITDVKVHLHITYMYPRLANSTGKHTQEWWDDQLEKLAIHEKIHGRIARESARELERELLKLKDLTCSNVKNAVSNRANFIFRKHKRRQEDYDRLTEHGLKQERYKGD